MNLLWINNFFLLMTGPSNSSHDLLKFLETGLSRTYNDCFVEALTAEAENDKRIVVVHGGMGMDRSLRLFQSNFPDRFFDLGIAEQHAVTFSAGLACGGLKPFCIIPSTFLQRAYDQVPAHTASKLLWDKLHLVQKNCTDAIVLLHYIS